MLLRAKIFIPKYETIEVTLEYMFQSTIDHLHGKKIKKLTNYVFFKIDQHYSMLETVVSILCFMVNYVKMYK